MANNTIVDYAENKILDHMVGKTSWTMPTTWLALYTTTPVDAGTGGVEVSGGAYARVATAGLWNAASGGSISNSADIVFPTATASWGTVVGVALLDAATVGNMIIAGALTASKTVGNGDVFKFLAGQLVFTLD